MLPPIQDLCLTYGLELCIAMEIHRPRLHSLILVSQPFSRFKPQGKMRISGTCFHLAREDRYYRSREKIKGKNSPAKETRSF